MLDTPYLVEPGKKLHLNKQKTDSTGPFKDKEAASEALVKNLNRLNELQDFLYAETKHAVLIVFQAMDAGGKDGAIDHVFSGVNPQGCQVTSFKVPSSLEIRHDYLWRIHQHCPPKGMIGIFNRSHYESVLVERVHNLVPDDDWKRRYEHINNFEKLLADEGTTILKFFLHISKDEQKKRLQERLDDPAKRWKFRKGDLADREHWDDYTEAYEDLLSRTSQKWAPWYVVPANKKWFRNLLVATVLVETLESLGIKVPEPAEDLTGVVIE